MESVAWTCRGCGIQIASDEDAVELVERRYERVGIVEGGGETRTYRYAHPGHEGTDIGLVVRRLGQGKLSELRADRRRLGD